jgi:DNA-binding NarL/FixJ family response regulator
LLVDVRDRALLLLEDRRPLQAQLADREAQVELKRAMAALSAEQRAVFVLRAVEGLSYKEIAEARTTAEHTVRNQALAIFRKAGLAGRAEMAAFFIEDLLMPRGPVSLRRPDRTLAAGGGAAA